MADQLTDLEISKALARAIGWEEGQLDVTRFTVRCLTDTWWTPTFDYQDWNVIGPIGERYDCFPYQDIVHGEAAWVAHQYYADTPQKAIALAVIKVAGVRVER
jgi:hypothetical protein